MPEHDINKERILSGSTIDAQDQTNIEEVRSALLEHVRIRKGLPPTPAQLDVEAISQLTDAKVINDSSLTAEGIQASAKIYNEEHPPLPEFVRRLRLKRISQLKKPPKREAA